MYQSTESAVMLSWNKKKLNWINGSFYLKRAELVELESSCYQSTRCHDIKNIYGMNLIVYIELG